ncbi:MAG TPA: AAA family ATPase [Haliscomenobacter sp.]|uniref:ATP-binding protein n=1 Tax=Haliscomenobacter sp. TaxID=2717303 RepID=UPI002D1BCEF8|nr:AAA family ATPase [Haliscomenobacter sp.]HOY16496.1 AAA family ATPase [Haliscomenobacter sp.]HPH18228.1 AAA family ATPase [Haliscomenobacter sp.]
MPLSKYFERSFQRRFQQSAAAVQPDESEINALAFFSGKLPEHNLTPDDLFLLTLALIPHQNPVLLDRLFADILGEGEFPQLGGIRGKQHRGILPTGETALFLLAKEDSEERIRIQKEYLSPNHWLFREQVLYLEPALDGEPRLSGKLLMNPDYVELFTTGEVSPPRFSTDFPAQLISTRQEWGDLVLHPHTRQQVESLQHWLEHGNRLLRDWGMDRKFKPGYRALFYGPPGTGKTLTAMLLGKHAGRNVYRVDLSMVVSKYIGETEKNLSKLFDKAEHKDWILFFDEADALFGKRTGVRDAHDRYANQEISYLLQRVEGYNGLVILASNLRENIDDAFLRRFQSLIHFPIPRPGERLRLWQNAIPEALSLEDDVDLKIISDRYEVSGADIMNIVHYCCLETMAQERQVLSLHLLADGIQRELQKLGKGG